MTVYALRVKVVQILGRCTADPPVVLGDTFTVCNGDFRIPAGGSVCLWALQSILPLIPPKERKILEKLDEGWMWWVHRAQCPDPTGRVLFEIERVGDADEQPEIVGETGDGTGFSVPVPGGSGALRSLRVVVEDVQGRCTSGMAAGDYVILRNGKLYVPPERHFCLYALHAALPLLPAKQRPLREGDWLKEACHVICPDPAGNVVMRIEEIVDPAGTSK